MPVYKRAARPTVEPREPLVSDNDFTVLLERDARFSRSGPAPMPDARFARTTYAPPPASTRRPIEAPTDRTQTFASYELNEHARQASPVTRQITPPGPAPRPPVFDRSAVRERPVAPRVYEEDRIETVTIAARPRDRFARVVALLALGCTFGFAVERFVRFEVAGPTLLPEEPLPTLTAQVTGVDTHETAPIASAATEPAPTSVVDAGVAVHHHHHHPAASAAPASSAPPASEEAVEAPTDDFAAAIQALSKAKEEVTLP